MNSTHTHTKSVANTHKLAENLSHHFLIATPKMPDPRFSQSVIYLCHHDDKGTLGLVINAPIIDTTVGQLFDNLDIEINAPKLRHSYPLLGGPIYEEVGFVLHTGQAVWASSFSIAENICLTTSLDILKSLANQGGPTHFQLFLGHASWAKGQLKKEIDAGDWLICPADSQLIFDTPYDERWHKAGQRLGVDLDFFSDDIGHA